MRKFTHERFYRWLAELSGLDEAAPAEKVFAPIEEEFENRKKSLINEVTKYSVNEESDETGMLKALKRQRMFSEMPWWKLFPFLLTPKRVNYVEAAHYMIYRLFSTSNTIYNVSPYLVNALYNTDFEIDFNSLSLPSTTFIAYWGDGNHSVLIDENSSLLYTFVDIIEMNGSYQIRQVYGHKDTDGDDANSGIMTLTINSEGKIDSKEFLETINQVDYSELSQMKVPEKQKVNNAKVYMLTFNLLLYLVASPEDRQTIYPHPDFKKVDRLSNPKKKRKMQKSLQNESRYRHIYIGGIYDRQVEQAKKSESQGEGAPLTKRTLVRGHWRHQWYGPRKVENGVAVQPGTAQKLVWIQPFWKGTDEPNRKTVVYEVR